MNLVVLRALNGVTLFLFRLSYGLLPLSVGRTNLSIEVLIRWYGGITIQVVRTGCT